MIKKEFREFLNGLGLKEYSNQAAAEIAAKGCERLDYARGYSVRSGWFVPGSDESFGLIYKETYEGQRVSLIGFYCDPQFKTEESQVEAVLHAASIVCQIPFGLRTERKWGGDYEVSSIKIRRRIEDALRKTANREDLLAVAAILHVNSKSL